MNIELFMSKESMEHELHNLMSKNYELEAQMRDDKSRAKKSEKARTMAPSTITDKSKKSETSVVKSKKHSTFNAGKPRRS